MSKLEEQKALPRRKLFKVQATTPRHIFYRDADVAVSIGMNETRLITPKPKRKAKKAKRKS